LGVGAHYRVGFAFNQLTKDLLHARDLGVLKLAFQAGNAGFGFFYVLLTHKFVDVILGFKW
jgi:hypothetical protein